jgi:HlyD family secretion protein
METPDKRQPAEIAQTLGLHPSAGKKWILRVASVAVVAAAVYAGAGYFMDKKRAASAVHYETKPVERGALTVTISATGTLQPVNKVEVGSEVSGTMKSVEADYNDHVKIGQVLARIDTSKLEAEVQESEAALEAARAQVLEYEATLKEGEAQLARLTQVRQLSGGKVPSQYEFEAQEATVARARANVANAQASVSKADATLRVNRSDLNKAVIHSPINGVVLTRSIEPGQTVAASMETPVLFKLAEDLKQLELEINVDEADVGQVKEGQDATFTVDAYPDKRFPASIKQVRYGSTTTDSVVTYTTVLKVNNDDLALRPGMTATAVVTTKKISDALLVPSAALRFEPPAVPVAEAKTKSGGSLIDSLLPHPPHAEAKQPAEAAVAGKKQTVYVVRDGRLVAIPVETGLTDGVRTEIVSGDLAQGVDVVIDQTTGAKK